jgi:uncharacterized membrane protein YdbT with pleckstrin-like domain
MSYLDRILQPNEQVVATGRKHWIIYGPGVAALIPALVLLGLKDLAGGAAFAMVVLAGLVAIFAFVLLFREWFEQWTTEIVVTSKRVVYKRGFISRYTREMNMEKIESVAVDQNLLGRLLGYGTIDIRGTGAGIEQLRGIAAPLAVRNAITAP